MSDKQEVTESEVFNQELSLDDLDAITGGAAISGAIPPGMKDANTSNCSSQDIRQIYDGEGFPNCANSVEDGSWCSNSDACKTDAISYKGMRECSQSWR